MNILAIGLLWTVLTAMPGLARGAEGGAQAEEPETRADEIDTTRWVCSLCAYPLGWFGTVEFGAIYVSDSSPKFGDYRGLDEKGGYLALDGDIHFRNPDGRYYDLYARNLGLESRRVEMRGGNQGHYELRLGYSEIPKYRGFETRTPFIGVGTEQLTLPTDWVRSPVTGGMSFLDQALADTPLKMIRRTLDAGLTVKLPTRWSWRVDFEHQEKNGTRPFGAGLFQANTTHFPAPVDFTTNQFDMALEYAGERASLSFGFAGSAFDNGKSSITWENPFQSAQGTQSFRADLAPDNEYYQFNLVGAFAPTPKLRLSGRAAIGRMQQDDPFLPYSTNPLYSDWPLPRSSLGGKIDSSTLNLAGKLTARLARRLELTSRVRLDERDNKTAVELWTPVLTDLVPTPERPNRPYSFKRGKYEVEMRWRAGNRIRLLGGIGQYNIERSLQSVDETRERIYWGELTLDPWAVAHIRLKLESSRRNASPYLLLEDGGPVENPLMRKFHLADRDRDRVIVDLDLSLIERLGISLSYFMAEDEYSASLVGLQASEDRSLSLDMSYAINSRLSLYAYFNQENIDSKMSSVSGRTGLAWNAISDDSTTTVGIGINGRISRNLSFGFDWVSSDATGKMLTESGQGEAPFPSLRSDLQNARFHFSYRLSDHWSAKFYAEHEKYDSTDWALDGLGPDGLLAVLTLGSVSPDYSVTAIRFQASYRF